MDRTYLDRISTAKAEHVLKLLTQRQHLRPANSLAQVLESVCRQEGYDADAGRRAIVRMRLDPAGPVGRLKRAQIIQLAQMLETLWQEELSSSLRPSSSKLSEL